MSDYADLIARLLSTDGIGLVTRREAADAIEALEAALAAPVACKVPSFLTDFARYRTDRPFDVGLETTPWPKTEDGLYDMSLGTMLRFTRLQALEEAAAVADEYAEANEEYGTVHHSALPAVARAIRALAGKKETT